MSMHMYPRRPARTSQAERGRWRDRPEAIFSDVARKEPGRRRRIVVKGDELQIISTVNGTFAGAMFLRSARLGPLVAALALVHDGSSKRVACGRIELREDLECRVEYLPPPKSLGAAATSAIKLTRWHAGVPRGRGTLIYGSELNALAEAVHSLTGDSP